ncbi:tryptophan halogenase family protein [Xanthomonas campestris]|uniref:tryptophan halogenase family protein n=1 Tax=Xanthomonas campestris TaxID=339 RepID=UPI00094AFA8E|nr:tryptophan halogenase family protein [Xanthomonas campestris]MEA0671908.1 tryptophan 7-halogenase [Xanthomonas campestris pv. campestris]MEB2081129.1 tryptophan halogenase family protein [Xanthomonas campestris pv. campestris]MEB2164304.1 tryptophan halogenase family protein [Xanthomonas campestris pv. campestris]
MTQARIRKVVIAGGGTAGWVAAAALAHQFRGLLEIVLVESEQIGTIGVGESTVPPIRAFHRFLQIDEQEFLRAVAGTFKLAISFEDWQGQGDRYIHPFGSTGQGTLVCAFHHFWLEAQRRGMHSGFDEYCLEAQAARADRFAVLQQPAVNYAYHLDAGLYARFLRTHAQRYGATRIEGKIQQVRQHADSGFVEALVLEDGQVVEGDLFIDCTGFRGLLIEQTLHTGYEDWSHWLPCDRAFAVQTESVEPPVPYTRAIAHAAGWRWQIPLQHRVGNGLVYARAHLSDDEASAMLLAAVQGTPRRDPMLVPFVTGRRLQTWNKNVVALGLASGFVEPLESTSIHLAIVAVMRLITLFPADGIAQPQVDLFNRISRAEAEHVRDFVILHYHATQREEALWRQCRAMELPESLQLRLRAWREGAHAWQDGDELFRVDSWTHVLLGQRVAPAQHHPLTRALPDQHLQQLLDGIRQPLQHVVTQLPTQQAFIDSYCKVDQSTWG